MKKRYQIESQRAVKQREAMAAEEDPAVQMILAAKGHKRRNLLDQLSDEQKSLVSES